MPALIAEAAAESFGRRLRLEYRFVAARRRASRPSSRAGPGAPPVRDHPLVREALAVFGGTIVREGRAEARRPSRTLRSGHEEFGDMMNRPSA